MKRFQRLSILFLIMLSLCLCVTGCSDDDDDDDDDECACVQPPEMEENGLALLFERQQVRRPANVGVLFKVETAAGEPVSNLDASDFRIYEDGSLISRFESQQDILPKPGAFTYHVLLLLDLSGSVLGSENLENLKTAASRFVRALMPSPTSNEFGTIQMAIRWFDGASELHPLVSFTAEEEELLAGVDSIREDMSSDPSTNLYGAVIQGVRAMDAIVDDDRDSVSVGAVVLFTDGKDQAARRTREEAVQTVTEASEEVSVYTIGLGGEIDLNVLDELGQDGFIFANDIEELVSLFESVADTITSEVNSHYLLEYCSPKRRGDHDLTIEADTGVSSGALTTCFCASGFEGGCVISDER